MKPGPDARVKFTEEYARHVARDVYFWAWPLVNMYTRDEDFSLVMRAYWPKTAALDGTWTPPAVETQK